MAIVNKIIHSSVVDGPGNRAAVFLQKCNFKCSYCHNPETIGQCVQCGACVEKCPAKALSLKDGKIVWDEDKCCECDTCIHVCPHIVFATSERLYSGTDYGTDCTGSSIYKRNYGVRR